MVFVEHKAENFHQLYLKKITPRTRRKALIYGIMNATTLRGDPKCTNLIVMYIDDFKPVYFLLVVGIDVI